MGRRRLTFDEFLRRANIAHANKYDYSLTQLTTQHALVDIICPIHGVFKIAPTNHIRNFDNSNPDPRYRPGGCGECGKEFTRNRNKSGLDTKETFIAKANNVHNNRFTYPGEYTGQNFKITIQCPDHGLFEQLASNHLRGTGCPRCKNSKGATKIAKYLTRLKIEFVQEHSFADCRGESRPLRFDFWLPTLNTLIEFDGEHHFKPVRFRGVAQETVEDRFLLIQRYDSIKADYAAAQGIKLVRIAFCDSDKICDILKAELL